VDRCELFGGRLLLAQPRAGYRFSLDSLLLAWWAACGPDDRVLDAGAGVGVVALALAGLRGARDLTAVESQPELAALARENAATNGLVSYVNIYEGDVRSLPAPWRGTFDVVCANPPFREVGAGRISPREGRAAARAELTLTFEELCRAAAAALKPGGRFYFIHQPRRLMGLLAALGAGGFALARARFVHPRRGEAANLFLGAAVREGAADAVVLPPLVIWEGDEYGAEVAALYRGEPDALRYAGTP